MLCTVCIQTFVFVHTFGEKRSMSVFSLIFLPLIFETKSLNELEAHPPILLDWPVSNPPRSSWVSYLSPGIRGTHRVFYVVVWDPNLGVHSYVTSTIPSGPWPQSLQLYFHRDYYDRIKSLPDSTLWENCENVIKGSLEIYFISMEEEVSYFIFWNKLVPLICFSVSSDRLL